MTFQPRGDGKHLNLRGKKIDDGILSGLDLQEFTMASLRIAVNLLRRSAAVRTAT